MEKALEDWNSRSNRRKIYKIETKEREGEKTLKRKKEEDSERQKSNYRESVQMFISL